MASWLRLMWPTAYGAATAANQLRVGEVPSCRYAVSSCPAPHRRATLVKGLSVSKTKRNIALPPPAGPLVPIETAEAITGLPRRTIRSALSSGRLTAYRPSGFERGRLYFTEAELLAFKASALVPGGAR